jgi:hypothetical protein
MAKHNTKQLKPKSRLLQQLKPKSPLLEEEKCKVPPSQNAEKLKRLLRPSPSLRKSWRASPPMEGRTTVRVIPVHDEGQEKQPGHARMNSRVVW